VYLSEKRIKKLYETSNTLRQDVIKMLEKAGSGHSAGSLDMADIFSALYFLVLNHNPKEPLMPERDRLILSNGHICPILYASLARAGYFSMKELDTLRKFGSGLQGHPHRGVLPGIENTSGPLGEGLSQAIGIALSARLNKEKHRIYVIMSDGEHDEGNVWEAVMAASKYRLNNITAIIDRNGIQIDGRTEDVMPLESLRGKYEEFGWNVIEIDGHNIEEFIAAIYEAKAIFEKPTVIIANTIAGKGVKFMEGKYEWHGKVPTKEEEKEALKELRRLGGKIKSEHD